MGLLPWILEPLWSCPFNNEVKRAMRTEQVLILLNPGTWCPKNALPCWSLSNISACKWVRKVRAGHLIACTKHALPTMRFYNTISMTPNKLLEKKVEVKFNDYSKNAFPELIWLISLFYRRKGTHIWPLLSAVRVAGVPLYTDKSELWLVWFKWKNFLSLVSKYHFAI